MIKSLSEFLGKISCLFTGVCGVTLTVLCEQFKTSFEPSSKWRSEYQNAKIYFCLYRKAGLYEVVLSG